MSMLGAASRAAVRLSRPLAYVPRGAAAADPFGVWRGHPIAGYAKKPMGTAKTAQKARASSKTSRQVLAEFDEMMRQRAPLTEAEKERRLRRKDLIALIRTTRERNTPMGWRSLLELLRLSQVPNDVAECFSSLQLLRTFRTDTHPERLDPKPVQRAFADTCVRLGLTRELALLIRDGKPYGLLPESATFSYVLRKVAEAGDVDTYKQLEALAAEEKIQLPLVGHFRAKLALAVAEHAAGKASADDAIARVKAALTECINVRKEGGAARKAFLPTTFAAEALGKLGVEDPSTVLSAFVPDASEIDVRIWKDRAAGKDNAQRKKEPAQPEQVTQVTQAAPKKPAARKAPRAKAVSL